MLCRTCGCGRREIGFFKMAAAAGNGGSGRNGGEDAHPAEGRDALPAEGPLSRQEAVEYIASMLDSMRVLAERAGLTFLSYLIGMAQEEANSLKAKRD